METYESNAGNQLIYKGRRKGPCRKNLLLNLVPTFIVFLLYYLFYNVKIYCLLLGLFVSLKKRYRVMNLYPHLY